MNDNTALVLIILIICSMFSALIIGGFVYNSIIVLSENPYLIRFEMDDNMLEALKITKSNDYWEIKNNMTLHCQIFSEINNISDDFCFKAYDSDYEVVEQKLNNVFVDEFPGII